MGHPRYSNRVNPSLYQFNTRALLSSLGKGATLDHIPDHFIDDIATKGFDWAWPLGVWAIGPTGQNISRSNTAWHREYEETLKDLTINDISGSPFAVCEYVVDPSLGGDRELAHFRERLEQRGIKLLLDFVPNHIGFDHRWALSRPDFLMQGTTEDLSRAPDCWTKLPSGAVAAFGRDPNYPGWPDTLQLNFFNPQLRAAMIGELRSIATRCSGVRCDMAMLLEPEVFKRTWGGRPESASPFDKPFWPEAIASVRRDHPHFLFLAEVYWNYEQRLQEHGFDYTYDKTLYDHLMHHRGEDVFRHLAAPSCDNLRMAHFLENHDEPRVASRLSLEEHKAAAVISFLAPGLRFLHHGEPQGWKVRIPVHLSRGPVEPDDPEVVAFYQKLIPIMNCPTAKYGEWTLLPCAPAWEGNPTHSHFIAYLIAHESGPLLVTVNYANYRSQCYVQLPGKLLTEGTVHLIDQISSATYERSASDLVDKGLFLDVEGFTAHIFSVRTAT